MSEIVTPRDALFTLYVDHYGFCWIWCGPVSSGGFGLWRLHGRTWFAHRYVWWKLYGEIPKGQHVLHLCEQRLCVHPEHLYLGRAVNHLTKISHDDASIIRANFAAGTPVADLAQRYSVTAATIRHAINEQPWRKHT